MNVEDLVCPLIALSEGLRLIAYQDSGGVWTIGRGHTLGVKKGDTCTVEQATAWFRTDAAPLFALVKDLPLLAAAAYVDFGYNCGYHACELVLQGTAHLENFIHDHRGNVLDELVRRRTLEAALIEAAQ